MADLNLELGVPAVSPISAQSFTAKPSNAPHRTPVAVIVAHGMGQQVPYETIDGVAQAAQRGAEEAGATIESSVIRSVRLGTQNDNDIETQLVRVECEVDEKQGPMYDVHIYEAYWAPLTEGKVTAARCGQIPIQLRLERHLEHNGENLSPVDVWSRTAIRSGDRTGGPRIHWDHAFFACSGFHQCCAGCIRRFPCNWQ
jgi:hypothetical protein